MAAFPKTKTSTRSTARFLLPLQVQTVAQHSDVIPGVVETVGVLRSRGIAIASTTGYPREVMDVVVRVAAEQGYGDRRNVCAGDTPAGRPGPFMALQALIRLSISPVEAVVKIGDTAVDIEEGLNGGMWSVGVAVTGNEVGLTAAEYAARPDEERLRLAKQATERLLAAGAPLRRRQPWRRVARPRGNGTAVGQGEKP